MKISPVSDLAFCVLALILFAAPLLTVARADAATGTFMVKNGAAPWSDRVGTWGLAKVPASLEGKGPLPQQSCGTRTLVVPAGAKEIVLGVSTRDVAVFKAKFPKAEATGETLTVEHPDGSNEIPYTVFKFADPPASIGDKALTAGLILLGVGTSGSS